MLCGALGPWWWRRTLLVGLSGEEVAMKRTIVGENQDLM